MDQQANIEYRRQLKEIANEVDLLLLDEINREHFADNIKRLCKMVEDYGKAQQPYAKKLKKTQKRIEELTPQQLEEYKSPNGEIKIIVNDECPPPTNYIEISIPSDDHLFINLPPQIKYRPKEPVNPLLWFGLFGDSNIQKEPTHEETLMWHYFLLATIHDYELKKPIGKPIFIEQYNGMWFDRDEFRKFIWHGYELSKLTLFLKKIKRDLEKLPRNGGENEKQGTPETDSKLIYQADAAEFYNIPKSTLSKASSKKPSEVGYLWSGHKGKRVFYRKTDCDKLSRSRTKLK